VEKTLKDREPLRRSVGDLTPAAVLMLLMDSPLGAEVLLTVRSRDVKDHKGQVSLPGGMREPSDPDFLSTAIRESVEEVGLEPDGLRILGRLDDYKTITGYHVAPFVGAVGSFDGLKPMTDEITEVFSFPLDIMADTNNVRRMPVDHPDRYNEILFVDYQGHVIWGATARILNGLMELLF